MPQSSKQSHEFNSSRTIFKSPDKILKRKSKKRPTTTDDSFDHRNYTRRIVPYDDFFSIDSDLPKKDDFSINSADIGSIIIPMTTIGSIKNTMPKHSIKRRYNESINWTFGADDSVATIRSDAPIIKSPNKNVIDGDGGQVWIWRGAGDLMESRGKNNVENLRAMSKSLNNPFIKKWLKIIGKFIYKIVSSAIHGVVGVVSVVVSLGMDGDVIVNTVFAVIDTVLGGLSSIQNSVAIVKNLLGAVKEISWFPFTNDISDLYDRYRIAWMNHPDIAHFKLMMQTNTKKLLAQVVDWSSVISGWMSVIVPDDAGAVKIISDLVGQGISIAAEVIKPEMLLALFEKMMNGLLKIMTKVTKPILDAKIGLIDKIQQLKAFEIANKLKIPLMSVELRIKIAQSISHNERVITGATKLQQSATWSACKSIRLLIILINHTNDKKLMDKLIPDSFIEDLIMIHQQLPSIVNHIFQTMSIVIGLCALASISAHKEVTK